MPESVNKSKGEIVRPPQVGDLICITLPNQKKIITSIVGIDKNTLIMKQQDVKLTWENSRWLLPDGLTPNDVKFYLSPKTYLMNLAKSENDFEF